MHIMDLPLYYSNSWIGGNNSSKYYDNGITVDR